MLCVCSLCPSSSSFLSLDISFLAKSWLMAITVCWLLLVHLLLKDWPLILSWIKIWGVSWPWIQNVNLMISRPFSYHFYLVISRWKTCKLPPRLRNEGKQKLVNCDHLRHWSCILSHKTGLMGSLGQLSDSSKLSKPYPWEITSEWLWFGCEHLMWSSSVVHLIRQHQRWYWHQINTLFLSSNVYFSLFGNEKCTSNMHCEKCQNLFVNCHVNFFSL